LQYNIDIFKIVDLFRMESMAIDLVTFGKALADETRQRIMTRLCCRELCVSDLVAELEGLSQPAVSHHLQILKAAGLVETRREGKQVFYTLRQQAIVQGCCGVAQEFAPEIELILATDETPQE
jgi:DNA-binding transcriptional ArsR family regulator